MRLVQLKHIDKWSEKVLLRECLDNNEKAQRYLFENHQARLFTICMRYVDNEDEGFDVKIFNSLKQLDVELKVTSEGYDAINDYCN